MAVNVSCISIAFVGSEENTEKNRSQEEEGAADAEDGIAEKEEEVIEEEIDLDASVGYSFSETMDPPSELLMPLLPYQKQFLAWAMKQVNLPGAALSSLHSL
jgi:DNA repair protein RAD16